MHAFRGRLLNEDVYYICIYGIEISGETRQINFPSVLRVYRDSKNIYLFGNVVLFFAVSPLERLSANTN